MSVAVLTSNIFQGLTIGTLTEDLGAGAIAMLSLPLSDASGTMTDSVLGNDGTVAGPVERGLAGIAAGSPSGSCAGDGTSATVTVPHISRYNVRESGVDVGDFSVSVYAQIDTMPAVSSKFAICAKAKVTDTGRWSIEVYNDAGTLKLRGQIGGTWIGAETGVATLALETAYRVVLTYTGTTAALWLDDGTAAGSQTIATGGAVHNTADLIVLAYNGAAAALDGIASSLTYWDGALDQTAIEALPDAVSIAHTPSEPAEFTCLARTSGTLVNTFKNLGALAGSAAGRVPVTGGNARYDLTGSGKVIHLIDLPPGDEANWDGNRCFLRVDTNAGAAAHSGACFSGGYINCPEMTAALRWNSLYEPDNTPRPSVHVRGEGLHNLLFEGFRCHGAGWDAYSLGDQTSTHNAITNITIRKAACTMQRDDFVENDTWVAGVLIDECYIEAMILISCNNSGFDGSSRINTIQNSLCYVLPVAIDTYTNRISGRYIKVDDRSVRFRLINNIFAVPTHSSIASNDTNKGPLDQVIRLNKMHPDSTGNTICWLGAGSYPYTNPDAARFTIQTGSTATNTWNNSLAAWWDAFPGHRLAGDPAAP